MKIKIVNMHIFFLILYLMTKPLYILKDSPIQIADLILLINIVFLFLSYRRIIFSQPEKMFILIIVYQLLINIFSYFMWSGETVESFSLIKNNLYYIFNFLLMVYISTLSYFGDKKVIRGITKGLTLSMIVILVGLILNIGTSRNASFFNNPNQLGYYAILVITSTALLENIYTKFQKVICITISFLSILMCTSKAAIIAVVIFYIVYYGTKKKLGMKKLKINIRKIIFVSCLFVLGIIFVVKFKDILLGYTNVLLERLKPIVEGNSNLGSGRGYDRVKEIGLSILWGVGEGAFYRFSIMNGNETHSSYATIIVSYGIIGFGFYIVFLKKIIREKYFEFFIIFSGVFVYWISHNGLRSSLLWILLVLRYEIKKGENNDKKK